MKKGTHILLDWYGCDRRITNNAKELLRCLFVAAKLAGCNVLHSYSFQFEPQGSTAVVVLSESHISAHSSPEHNYIAIDIYTCGDLMEPDAALEYLNEQLRPNFNNEDTGTKTRYIGRY